MLQLTKNWVNLRQKSFTRLATGFFSIKKDIKGYFYITLKDPSGLYYKHQMMIIMSDACSIQFTRSIIEGS